MLYGYMRVGSSAGWILVISPDSRTACELHYHLNVGQPRVSSAYRAIVLSIGFALVFAGQGTTFPCRHSCFAATEAFMLCSNRRWRLYRLPRCLLQSLLSVALATVLSLFDVLVGDVEILSHLIN